jgi:PKD repeat protein
MEIKKIMIAAVVIIFVCSMLPSLMGQADDMITLEERKYKENREIIPIITKNGLERIPNPKGKPVTIVDITYPIDGEIVSGTVTITITSNSNPNIIIDGVTVGKGLNYDWITTQYSDGSHTITASAKGVTDSVTVTVNNGGVIPNNPPIADFTYIKSDLIVDFTDQSTDSDGNIISYYWEFGDGSTSTSQNPSYTYSSDGTYTVSLTVTDDDYDTDTTSQDISVSSSGGDVDKYALVIGISDYEGTANDLNYCDDDAQDWKNFLQSEGYTVTMLTDNQATADNIEAKIIQLLADEDGDDYVVLTYSGHGYDYTGYGSCIISHDLYYITHGFFESYFDTADSQHIYFAFDACEIGGFQGLIDSNRVGAFASNRRLSYDGDSSMQNGVFTYYQMEGWDIYDNFEENAAYAVQNMKDWAPRFIKVDPFYVDQFTGPMTP